jgi:hypothetical protein
MSTLKEALTEAIAEMIGDILIDEEYIQSVADRINVELTPYNDDGSTEADTYLLCVYFGDSERWSPSVRLLDLIHDRLDDTLAYPDSWGRDGYDKALEGLVAELTECLALAQRALQVERIKGIRDGNWTGSIEDAP